MDKIITAVDLHGTLTNDEYGVLKYLMLCRHNYNVPIEWWVVSGGPTKEVIETQLTEAGVFQGRHYDNIICVVDYLEERGVKIDRTDPGNPWCDPAEWWASKAKIMEEFNMVMLIDDKLKYYEHIKPTKRGFILYSEDEKEIAKARELGIKVYPEDMLKAPDPGRYG